MLQEECNEDGVRERDGDGGGDEALDGAGESPEVGEFGGLLVPFDEGESTSEGGEITEVEGHHVFDMVAEVGEIPRDER